MLDPIVNAFINVMVWIAELFNNIGVSHGFGWTIIIFTILIRLALYPFTASQVKSTKAQQEFMASPEWQKIQKKYANDKEKLAQEQMRLYQEMGINPLGACLPTVLQLPIIFALYWSVTRALASTPLQLVNLLSIVSDKLSYMIPLSSTFLWMDLSQPERLYLPFLPNLGIPVLAILVMITSYLQTKLMETPTASNDSQSQAMTKMMSIYMPVFIGWISYTYASGLALYFFVSNVATILQYAIMGRLNFKNLLPKFK